MVVALFVATSARAQPVTLRITAAPSIFANMYEQIVEQFERDNPDIRLELQVSAREYDDLAQQTLRAAITGDLPDVSFQGVNRVHSLVARGLAVPLDSFAASDPAYRASGAMQLLSKGTKRDKTYFLPFGVSAPIVYYNQALLERAGIKQLPTDWPDILRASRKISALDSHLIGGFIQYAADGNWTFMALLNSFGGNMATPDNKDVAFNGPAGLKALSILRAFGEAGQARLDLSQGQARQAFSAGAIGILVDSSSSLSSFEREAQGRFVVRTAPMPISSAEGFLPAAGPALVMLARNPARQAAAWRFIAFATGPKAQSIMARNTGYVSINQVAIHEARWLGDYYVQRLNLAAVLDELPRLGKWYAFPGRNSIKISHVIKEYLEAVVLLKQTPQEALPRMTYDVQMLLAE